MKQTEQAIEQTLTAYIREECLPKNGPIPLDVHDDLFQRGIVDSAGLISFIGFVEREYALSIPDEDLLPQNFATISSIAGYIRSRQGDGHARH
jgi:acyl carrier protein